MQFKICSECGVQIERPKKYSVTQWEERRFCTVKCGRTQTQRLNWQNPAYREKLINSFTGTKRTEQHKQNLSTALKKPRPTCRGEARGKAWKGGISLDIKAYKAMMWRKRRAYKLDAGGSHTDAEWYALKQATGNKCLCCGAHESEKKLTRDHVIPLIVGGTDNIDNIQPLCQQCNSRKAIYLIDYREKGLADAIGFHLEVPEEE